MKYKHVLTFFLAFGFLFITFHYISFHFAVMGKLSILKHGNLIYLVNSNIWCYNYDIEK